MHYSVIARLGLWSCRRPTALWAMLFLGCVLSLFLTAGLCRAQTPSKPDTTHLKLKRSPTKATVGQEVEFTILLTNTRTHSGIPNKVVRLLFDGQEINREPTDGTGQIRYRYKIPEDTVPATTPNAKPNARQVPLQAIYDGDPQTKKKTLTSRMTVRSRQTYLGGGPSIPNQQYKLEVSDAVFYDANTVVKYYGNVGLEARLTYGDKGVNGKTVTFRIPNRQGKEYTVRVTTEADGYARISLQNVTWLLVADGPWTITASAMGATGSGTLTLQK